jgi:hypothetical protein
MRKARSLALGLIAGVALTMAAAAQDATGAGTGVTFINGSNHHVDVYTSYGSDASCGSKPQSKKVGIDAGQSGVVDSGSSSVCFCLKVPNRGTCPSGGWAEVKAGGTRRLQ